MKPLERYLLRCAECSSLLNYDNPKGERCHRCNSSSLHPVLACELCGRNYDLVEDHNRILCRKCSTEGYYVDGDEDY